MKLDFIKYKGLKASISNLIEGKVSAILKKLNSLDHLSDFVKIITICLSKKFKGDETKLRNEFIDIFDKKEDLTDEFIDWLKIEIPKHLEQYMKNEDSPKKESPEKKKATEKKEGKKGILDRVKFPDRSKKSEGLKIKNNDQNDKKGKHRSDRRKRNQQEFEEGFSDSQEYSSRRKSKKKI